MPDSRTIPKGPWLPIVSGLALAAILVWVGTVNNRGTGESDIWFEVAKGGVWLGVVAVLGGLVAFQFRWVEQQQSEEARVKAVRQEAYESIRGASDVLLPPSSGCGADSNTRACETR